MQTVKSLNLGLIKSKKFKFWIDLVKKLKFRIDQVKKLKFRIDQVKKLKFRTDHDPLLRLIQIQRKRFRKMRFFSRKIVCGQNQSQTF
jgi:phenylalanine-4-hydroxylase